MGKIKLFIRHCHFSEASHHKKRLPNFSRQRCYENLLETIDRDRAEVTFLLDQFYPSSTPHFITQQKEFPVIEYKAGSEASSFLQLLDYIISLQLAPDEIVYLLEDDYLHKAGWVDILLEGFTLPNVSYITLYDHRDKYFLPIYQDLQAKLFHTSSCHWRTTPSTTNSYAMRVKTLLRDLSIHRKFSLGRKITADHEKFLALNRKGASLISSLPAWSTHVEEGLTSPCVAWKF